MKFVWLLGVVIILFGTYSWVSSSSTSMNLVALGDSITYGTGDPTKRGYIKRIQARMEEEQGIPIQLKNYGVPKNKTEDILNQLQERGILKQLRKANYIILYIGTNDFRNSANYEFRNINVNGMKVSRKSFGTKLTKILEILRMENSKAPIIVLGLYHAYTEYDNQKEILGHIEQWNNEINACLENYDHTYYVSTLDLLLNRHKEEVFSDSLHPNSTGYDLIADRLLQRILTLETNQKE